MRRKQIQILRLKIESLHSASKGFLFEKRNEKQKVS